MTHSIKSFRERRRYRRIGWWWFQPGRRWRPSVRLRKEAAGCVQEKSEGQAAENPDPYLSSDVSTSTETHGYRSGEFKTAHEILLALGKLKLLADIKKYMRNYRAYKLCYGVKSLIWNLNLLSIDQCHLVYYLKIIIVMPVNKEPVKPVVKTVKSLSSYDSTPARSPGGSLLIRKPSWVPPGVFFRNYSCFKLIK